MENWVAAPGAKVCAHAEYVHPANAQKGSRKFLSFGIGQEFLLIKQGSKDWWLAQLLHDPSVSGYIPVNHVTQIQEPPSYTWMAGRISRHAAEEALSRVGTPDGTFLVRESEKKSGAYSLSMRVIGGSIKHMKILHTPNVGYELAGVSPLQTATLEDLLRYFEVYPLSPSWGQLLFPSASPSRTAPPPPAATAATPQAVAKQDTEPMEVETSSGPTPSRAAPPPPTSQAETAITSTPVVEKSITRPAPASPVVDTTEAQPTPIQPTQQVAKVDLDTFSPEDISDQLVQAVRDVTKVNFKVARDAAAAVAFFIAERLDSATANNVLAVIKSKSKEQVLGGADIERLTVILEELTGMANDAQQRSWSIYDDEGIIKEYLEEFMSIIENADFRAIKMLIETFHSPGSLGRYEIIDTLVNYYQMETRTELRLLLLRIFGALGSNDPTIFPILQNSVMPLELARDMMVNTWLPENSQRILYSLLLCTMIFSCGLPMPVNHYDVFNESFLKSLLGIIEHNLETEEQDSIAEQATFLLLAFNLHFAKGGSNMVMDALSGIAPRRLNQRIMLLFNRDTDPVAVAQSDQSGGGGQPKPPNSVLKFVHDIFDNEGTATGFFFTSDTNVLIDVLIRELVDREPTDPRLDEYVGVALGIVITQKMTNSEPYREDDLKDALNDLRGGLEITQSNSGLLTVVNELLNAF